MKTKRFVLVFLMLITTLSFSQTFEKQGAGATILVHGWDPDGNQPAWMTEMANAIVERNGGVGHIATITVTGTQGNLTATCSDWSFDLAAQDHAEIIVLLNWTAVANHLNTGITAQEVAAAVAPKIYTGQEGQPALSELPIHLIGHSRGGGMVFEIARLLGEQGIEIDHLTALDPHPLTAADPQPMLGDVIDTPVDIYENVLFADCYYQNIEAPTGEYVNGAFNRLWTSMPGGYHNESGYTWTIGLTTYDFSDHLNTILAYHGTIDLTTPTSNGEATMTATERAWFNAYENAGENTGFKYSRNIRGDRTTTDEPVPGADKVADGYHQDFTLGYGTRTAQNWTSAVWPNIITSELIRSGNTIPYGNQTLTLNEALVIRIAYRSYAMPSDLTFYVDSDRNPYNNNNVATIATENLTATGSTININTTVWSVTDLTAGNKYYVFGKIDDGTNIRYVYLPYQLELGTMPSITTHPQDQNNICPGSNVEFTIAGTNIENYAWEVNEGSGYTPLSNGSIYSGVATEALSITGVTLDMNNNEYRCVVSNTDGNATSNPATLTTDSENPVITSTHNDQQMDADGNCEAVLPDYTGDLTASDNCDDDLNVTQNPTAGSTISSATNTVILTVTDDAGNISEVSFNAEVVDNTNPTITCVENQVIDLNEGETFYTVQGQEFGPTLDDNCGISSAENDYNNTETLAGEEFATGTYTITWAVTDNAGNTADCSFDLTVNAFVGIANLSANDISIYPNPTSGILNLKACEAPVSVKNVEITDISGKTIKNFQIDSFSNFQIDITNQTSGIYFLKIETDNKISHYKIIKN